ncbi:rhomboid family intramembrane serine protease [Campylobacter sp. 19-13652]|uniref:rhomboid family intramembrane serine protease n=1 Tax=Campylobacter sp. 19-13652 TaxID=2840180 RepID=UPI001C761B1D|nr:rhomboid family intramembrane serine protease [Campylobacter sp. 19-13652]BCX79434.1 rhomboid family intramembrane serine protease [Campylobacter sp. 19-13652]
MLEKKAKITYIIIAINFLIFLFTSRGLTITFGLNHLFFDGLYFQIFTSAFLHGGFLHIAMNMAILYGFGGDLERAIGAWRYIFLYFVGILGSGIVSAFWVYLGMRNLEFINVIGASGAISALLGFVASALPSQRKELIVAILIMSFLPLLAGESVAWYSHIGGFVAGYIFAKVAR